MELGTIIAGGALLLSAASLGWTVWVHRSGARKRELDQLDARIKAVAGDLSAHKEAGQESRTDLGHRVAHVEQIVSQLPTNAAVHKLDVAITEVRGDLKAQGRTMEAMTESLRALALSGARIEDYLLKATR